MFDLMQIKGFARRNFQRAQRRRLAPPSAVGPFATVSGRQPVKGKTEMLQLRLMEKRKELVRRDAHEAMIDQMAGLVLMKLGGWPARVAGTDLVVRRRAEAVLRELRTEIAEACTKLSDVGEPPLEKQD